MCPIETAAARRADLPTVRALFLEYAASLDFSLCFQGFGAELAELPGAYAPPRGRLLLARAREEAAGCVALRPLGDGIAEIKRLYVRPAWRHGGLGRRLAERVLAEAEGLGYAAVRLDTAASMTAARSLYASLGFAPIAPYHPGASRGIDCFEKLLPAAGSRSTAQP